MVAAQRPDSNLLSNLIKCGAKVNDVDDQVLTMIDEM
jgi:hypothetical protein